MKKIQFSLLVLFLSIQNLLISQTNTLPAVQWNYTQPSQYHLPITTGEDWFYGTLATSDGGYLGVGYAEISGIEQPTVSKIDANGNKLWEQLFSNGAAGGKCLNAFEVSDGYVIFGDGGGQIFYLKIDKNTGAVIVPFIFYDASTFGYNSYNYGILGDWYNFYEEFKELRDASGDIIAFFCASALYDITNNKNAGGIIMAFDPVGNIATNFGNNGLLLVSPNSTQSYYETALRSVSVDYDASANPQAIVFSGTRKNSNLDNDIYIGKANLLGTTVLWEETFNETNLGYIITSNPWLCNTSAIPTNKNIQEFGGYIKQISNGGGYVMVAHNEYSLIFNNCTNYPLLDAQSYIDFDLALITLKINGNINWAKKIDHSTGIDFFTPIKVLPGNAGYIIGTNDATDPTAVKARIIKTDISGNILWSNLYMDNSHGQTENCLFGMDLTLDGGIVYAGNNDINDEDYEMVKIYNDCSSLPTFDIKDPSNIITLTSPTTTWNTSHKVLGMVNVATNQTLTISGASTIIQFADSKTTGIPTGITVQRGGKLVVSGATLTNITSCPATMWDGILVIGGGNNTPQTFAQQGVAFFNNTCHVNNARIAVSVGQDLQNNGGGWVIGSGANFLNNNVDIHMTPFIAPLSSGTEPNNKTNFSSCGFASTNYLNDPSYVDAFGNRRTTSDHVELNGVKGIGFSSCIFRLYLGGTNPLPITYRSDDRGYGILSKDATFYINSTTSLENLRYGVYATATNPLKTYSIDHSTFLNCYAGIYQNNINYSNVTFNTFKINSILPPITSKFCALNPNSSSCLNYCYYLNQCNGYIHQENTYTVTGGQKVLGTIFNSSTGVSNLSYLNNYTRLDRGHQAQAGNSSLQIQCNPNTGVTTADISVTSQGLNALQGNTGIAAGNTFTHLSPDGDIKVNLTGTNPLTYFYYNIPSQLPQYYTISKVTLSPSFQNTCLTNYPTTTCGVGCRMANITNLTNQIKINQQLLIQGDDQSLIDAINTLPEGQVQQALLSKSPYLSDRVLFAFLQHTPTFASGIIKNVIISNSSLTPKVMDAVNNLNLPSGIQKQINNAQTGINPRTALQASAQSITTQIYFNLHDALNQLLLNKDTTVQNANELIKILLSHDISKEVIYKADLAVHLIETGDFATAQTLLDSIKVLPGMANISKVHKHKLDLKQNNQTWYAMQTDASLKQDMQSIAADSTQIGFAAARSAFTTVYSTPGYENIEDLDVGESGSRVAHSDNNDEKSNLNNEDNKSLRVYPNPTNGMLTIKYSVVDPTCQEATLQLIELSTGRILIKKNVPCNSNQTEIDLKEFPNGVYSLSIESNLNAPKNIRIIKIQ